MTATRASGELVDGEVAFAPHSHTRIGLGRASGSMFDA
jgi:hypothetical protein